MVLCCLVRQKKSHFFLAITRKKPDTSFRQSDTKPTNQPYTTMNPTKLLTIVSTLSGHQPVTMRTESKPAAAFKGVKLEKFTRGTYRIGLSFENLKGVREGIENGEREVPMAPKGRKWVTYPIHLQNLDETTDYLRLYYPTGGFIQRPSVTYFVDGVSVDREVFNSYLTPSDAKPKEHDPNRDCFDVKMENIISIGKEAEIE